MRKIVYMIIIAFSVVSFVGCGFIDENEILKSCSDLYTSGVNDMAYVSSVISDPVASCEQNGNQISVIYKNGVEYVCEAKMTSKGNEFCLAYKIINKKKVLSDEQVETIYEKLLRGVPTSIFEELTDSFESKESYNNTFAVDGTDCFLSMKVNKTTDENEEIAVTLEVKL